MSNFAAIPDACVIIPAAVRDTLLRVAEAGLYRPHWSNAILDEVERNLIQILEKRGDDAADRKIAYLLAELRAQFPEAIVIGHELLIPTLTNDEKDRHVLAAAIKAGAQVIITNNLRHFPASALAAHNVEALTPDAFLCDVFDLYPETIAAILHQQAADMRQPKTVDDVLRGLQRMTPNFAKQVRQYFMQTRPAQ